MAILCHLDNIREFRYSLCTFYTLRGGRSFLGTNLVSIEHSRNSAGAFLMFTISVIPSLIVFKETHDVSSTRTARAGGNCRNNRCHPAAEARAQCRAAGA